MSIDWMISSDSHIIEPPDLWVKRIDAAFRDRAPRVVREPGGDWWYVNGQRSMSFLGVQTGDRFEKDATELIIEARFEQVRPAAYDPARYIRGKRGGRDAGVGPVPQRGPARLQYFPTAVLCSARHAACATTTSIAEFCGQDLERLKGVGLINVDDPLEAASELARCRELGLAGAMISVLPARRSRLRPPDVRAAVVGPPRTSRCR